MREHPSAKNVPIIFVVSDGKASGTGLGTWSARLLARAQHGAVVFAVDDAAHTTILTISLPAAAPA